MMHRNDGTCHAQGMSGGGTVASCACSMFLERRRFGAGTNIAEDINTAIDNAGHWTAQELRTHLMAIQPSRDLQALWDAAPDLLTAARSALGTLKAPAGRQWNIDAIEYLEAALAKAEGARP